MTSTGTVQIWNPDDGWGVLESKDTPGGCWVHFSAIDHVLESPVQEGRARITGGECRELLVGETVDFEWERPARGQDGWDFRATTLKRHSQCPGQKSDRMGCHDTCKVAEYRAASGYEWTADALLEHLTAVFAAVAPSR